MMKNKIGLLACALLLATACGDSTSGTGDNATGGDMTPTTAGDAGKEPVDGKADAGGDDPTGGTNATGEGNDEGGVPAGGACTNAADKAIIASATVPKLACEGAACAGKSIVSGAAGQTACINDEAPSLKQLSAGCRDCFDEITSCVPNKCVSFGMYKGTGECSISVPNTDFSKCPSTAAPDTKCVACQMRDCAPAFTTCSGISM